MKVFYGQSVRDAVSIMLITLAKPALALKANTGPLPATGEAVTSAKAAGRRKLDMINPFCRKD